MDKVFVQDLKQVGTGQWKEQVSILFRLRVQRLTFQ